MLFRSAGGAIEFSRQVLNPGDVDIPLLAGLKDQPQIPSCRLGFPRLADNGQRVSQGRFGRFPVAAQN